jgi:hypothetical protein
MTTHAHKMTTAVKTPICGNPQRVWLHVNIDVLEEYNTSSFRVTVLRWDWCRSAEVQEVAQSFQCVDGNVGEEIEQAPDQAEVYNGRVQKTRISGPNYVITKMETSSFPEALRHTRYTQAFEITRWFPENRTKQVYGIDVCLVGEFLLCVLSG